MASHRGNEAVVRLLFESVTLINDLDSQGRLGIQLAVLNLLLQYGTVFNSRYQDVQGCSTLHHAASSGCYDGAKMALDHGADIDLLDSQGWTALYWACRKGEKSTVELLLESGADRQVRNRQKQTPLAVSAFFGNSLLKSNLTVPGNHQTEDQQEGFELGDPKGAFCDACLHVCYSSVLKKTRLTFTARIHTRFTINALPVKTSISVIPLTDRSHF